MEENLKYIIESLLFVSEGPLPMDRLKKVLENSDTKEIKQAIDALMEEYEARGGGFMLREVAGGYQIRTRPEYAKWIRLLIQPGIQRLSKAALETLAIIAYKQPIIRADIEFVRGVDCGGVLRMLLERKLVRVLGRKEIPGRPMIYATTKQFLELFDLKDLKDLPSPKEIEALGNTHVLDSEPIPDDETDGISDDFNLPESGDTQSEIEESQNQSSDAGEMDDTEISDETVAEDDPSETKYQTPDSIETDNSAITEKTSTPDTDDDAFITIETENPDVSPWDTKGSDEIIEEQSSISINNESEESAEFEESEEDDPDAPEKDPTD